MGGDDEMREVFLIAYDDDWLVPFTHTTGQQIFEGEEEPTEYGIFSHFFDAPIINLLVVETNRYAATTISKKGGMNNLAPHSRFRKWQDVAASEMKAFLAILLLMGTDRRPNYDMYWTTEWTMEAPGLRSIMSRNRFQLILAFFSLYKQCQPNHSRRPQP